MVLTPPCVATVQVGSKKERANKQAKKLDFQNKIHILLKGQPLLW